MAQENLPDFIGVTGMVLEEIARTTDCQSFKIISEVMQTRNTSLLDAVPSAAQTDNMILTDEGRAECVACSGFFLQNLKEFRSEDAFCEGCAILIGTLGAYFSDGNSKWLEGMNSTIGTLKHVAHRRKDKSDEGKRPIVKFAIWCQTASSKIEGLSVFEKSILEEVSEGLLDGNYQSIEIISPSDEWSEGFLSILSLGLDYLYRGSDENCKKITEYIENILQKSEVSI